MLKPLPIARCLGLTLLFGVACSSTVFSQTLAFLSQTKQIAVPTRTTTVKNALLELQNHYRVEIVFEDRIVASRFVPTDVLNFSHSFEQNLSRLLQTNGLQYKKIRKGTFIITEVKPAAAGSVEEVHSRADVPAYTPQSVSILSPSQRMVTPVAPKALIKGTVTDETGASLPGVSVVLKGTSRGTTTDIEGRFQLDVPGSSATLVFSFVGYQTSEVVVGNQTVLNVQLKPEDKSLEEVVVVGYGTVLKSDITGSVSKISTESVNERPVTSVEQFLQGQVSGVQITQNTGAPGGGITFNIRGATSVSGSNQPLIVIDGYPIDTDNGAVRMSSGSQSGYLAELPNDNALASLNPGDIESVEILKDASATAIYGSRGSNGVVLITTKRGKSGRDRIEYNFRYDISQLPKNIEVLNTNDYLNYSNEAYLNDNRDSIFRANALAQHRQKDFNWQDLIYRTAISQNHQVSLSGGADKMKYAVVMGYLGQEGIVKNSRFDRGSLRINLDREISKNFKVGVNMSGSLSTNMAAMQSSTRDDVSTSVVHGALRSRPIDSPFTADDELDQSFVGNPLTLVNLAQDKNRVITVLANLFAEYQLAKGLKFRVNGGVNNTNSQRDFYHPRGTTLGNLEGGYAYRGHMGSFNYLTEYTLNFNRTIAKKHRINAVGGYTWQQWRRQSFALNAMNFPNDNMKYYGFSGANSFSKPVNSTTEWALASFLGRINYSFDNKYLITFTGRTDGSTRLAPGNKWAFFPSLALGWNVHNEAFIQSLDFLSQFKVRASYGTSGNQAISVGATQATLSTTTSVINQSVQTAYVLSSMPNSTLHWETTKQLNIGTDLAFFNNRVTFEFNYYNKRSEDLLISLVIPPSNGFTRYNTNLGVVENKGVEFDLGFKALTQGPLQWDLAGNLSVNRNKILDLGGVDSFMSGIFQAVAGQSLHIAKVGYPIGAFYGYRINGIYQNQEEINNGPTDSSTPKPGSFKYVDLNGDNVINADDREIIGNPYPAFIFGFTNNVSWRGLSLNVFLQGNIGQDVINANRFYLDALARGLQSNVSKEAYEGRWTGEGTSNYYPRATTMSTPFNSRFTDFIVEDASFVRVKNVTLSYGFPMGKIPLIRSLKLFASATNLLTFTNYKGYDPEISSHADKSMQPGIDSGSIPQYRTFSLGLNAGF